MQDGQGEALETCGLVGEGECRCNEQRLDSLPSQVTVVSLIVDSYSHPSSVIYIYYKYLSLQMTDHAWITKHCSAAPIRRLPADAFFFVEDSTVTTRVFTFASVDWTNSMSVSCGIRVVAVLPHQSERSPNPTCPCSVARPTYITNTSICRPA